MRTFLHRLMVDITRHPREVVSPVWSTSIVVNAFRIYEYWFGRRVGIRFEGSCQDGMYIHGTWENFLAHQEGRIRSLKKLWAFKLVPLPVLITPDGQRFQQNSIFNFAIAYDNGAIATDDATTNGSTITGFTVTGSNTYLISGSLNTGTSDPFTSATYNGISMTAGAAIVLLGNNWSRGYSLAGPATGSHNGVVTLTGVFPAVYTQGFTLLSYSGAAQVAIDAYATSSTGASTTVTNQTYTVNTATANCWAAVVMFSGNTITAGTNSTQRVINSNRGGYDSNGNIATGSFSMTVNFTSSYAAGAIQKFAEAAATAVNSGFFFFAIK